MVEVPNNLPVEIILLTLVDLDIQEINSIARLICLFCRLFDFSLFSKDIVARQDLSHLCKSSRYGCCALSVKLQVFENLSGQYE